jgi:translation initiation factor 3 subunit H
MKIMKHCRESLPGLATGQLVGLDADTVLQVTNTFPMPKNTEDADGADFFVLHPGSRARTLNAHNSF